MSKKNITHVQKEMLIDFMVTNHNELFGKFAHLRGKQWKDAKWLEIVTTLNLLGPPNKTTDQWKKVWI